MFSNVVVEVSFSSFDALWVSYFVGQINNRLEIFL